MSNTLSKKQYELIFKISESTVEYAKKYLELKRLKRKKHKIKFLLMPYEWIVASRIKYHGLKLRRLSSKSKKSSLVIFLHGIHQDFIIKKNTKSILLEKIFFSANYELADTELLISLVQSERLKNGEFNYELLRLKAYQDIKDYDSALKIGCTLAENPRLKKQQRRLLFAQPVMMLEMKQWLPKSPVAVPSTIKGRIAYIVASSLPYMVTGYTTRTRGVVQGYHSLGYDIHVITKLGFPLNINKDLASSDVPETELIDGVPHHRLVETDARFPTPNEYTLLAINALKKILGELNPEIVIAGSNFMNSLPALIAARQLGIPFVYEVRGMWELSRASREPEYAKSAHFDITQIMETFVAKEADQVLTLTTPMMRNLLSRGVDESRIALMPNGVDTKAVTIHPYDAPLARQLGLPSNVPVIGYVGSILQYEGLIDLAKACVGLAGRRISFSLLIVGEEKNSPDGVKLITKQIKEIFSQAQIQDRLFLPGRVPFSQVHAYYSLIDIAPIPRQPYLVSEMVSPIKPVEALAMGKTLVVSDVEALLDFVQGGATGLSFRKGDWNDLENKLALAIDDKKLRERFTSNGMEFVRNNRTWPKICEAAALHMGLTSCSINNIN
jgi:glycosyltransferase involved in cell wall biosynthesis